MLYQIFIGINTLILLSLIYTIRTQKGWGAFLNLGLLVVLLLTLLLHFLVGLNAWRLYNNVKTECECSDRWQKYVVYFQGINSSLAVVMNSISVLGLLFVLLFSLFKK